MPFIIFVFGTIIGSFLNVLIWRLPKEERITGRSHCVHCGHLLSQWELVPILSYIFLGGKCRWCRKKISPRYFVIELISGLLFVWAWYFVLPVSTANWTMLARDWFLLSIFLVVFTIDLEHYLILDNIIFPALVVVTILNLALDILSKQQILSIHSLLLSSILGAGVAAAPFFILWF